MDKRCATCGRRLHPCGEGYMCRNGHVEVNFITENVVEGISGKGSKKSIRKKDARHASFQSLSQKEVVMMVMIEIYPLLLGRLGVPADARKKYDGLFYTAMERAGEIPGLVNVGTVLALSYFIARHEREARGEVFLFYDFKRVLLSYSLNGEIKKLLKARGLRRGRSETVYGDTSLERMKHTVLQLFPETEKTFLSCYSKLREETLVELGQRFNIDVDAEMLTIFKRFCLITSFITRDRVVLSFSEVYISLFLLSYLICKYTARSPLAYEDRQYVCAELNFVSFEALNEYLLFVEGTRGMEKPPASKEREREAVNPFRSSAFESAKIKHAFRFVKDITAYTGMPYKRLVRLYRSFLHRYDAVANFTFGKKHYGRAGKRAKRVQL